MLKERFKEEFLRPDRKPRRYYNYWVTGYGEFPYDMLRYDAAWPVSSEDAYKMSERSIRVKRSIQMASYREPTVERWSSFLWSVGTENLHG